jgi:DNA polymerase III alpha subunit
MLMVTMMSDYYEFDCGCRVPIDPDSPPVYGRPSLIYRVEEMPLDCPRTWDLICSGRTRGLWQLESNLGRKWSKDIAPRNIDHLAAVTALLRPGCLRSRDERGVSMTELYKRRKNGEEPVEIDIEAVRDILEPTFDVIVFQEQFMRISQIVAGFDLVEVDKLRKASAKKSQEEMTKVGVIFVEKAEKLGVITREQAERLFANIRKTAKYSFNASHSVSYAIDCYWTAHEKAHFTVEFFTAYLAYAKDKPKPLDEIRSLVNEAKLFDIEVKPPRFADMEDHFSTDGVEITFGLADVSGVGDKKVRKMAESIAGVEVGIGKPRNVWSWFDFLVYFSGNVDAVLVRRMIEVGALRDFRLDRVRLLAEFDVWRRLTDAEKRAIAGLRDPVVLELPDEEAIAEFTAAHPGATVREAYDEGRTSVVIDEARPCDTMIDALGHALERNLGYTKGTRKNPGHPKPAVSGRRREAVQSLRDMLVNPPAPLVDKPYWIAKKEEEALGIPLTCTHVDSADQSLVNATCKDFRDGLVDSVVLGVEVQEAKEVLTKLKREPMAFLSISDSTGSLDDVVIFPEAWKQYGHILAREKTVVAIRGTRDPGRGSLIVDEVWAI